MKAPSPPKSPWQLFYGGVHFLRRRWYGARARHLPRPVISVGNLHWGGSGKTPLVAAIAAHLRDRGLAVCILSRGYGSQGRGVRVVSAGEGPLLGPLVAGDEPVLLAGGRARGGARPSPGWGRGTSRCCWRGSCPESRSWSVPTATGPVSTPCAGWS